MKIKNPVKAIRAKCIDCCAGQVAEVERCVCTDCALYPFRMGKNPYRTPRVMTDEQRQAAAARLTRFRSTATAGADVNGVEA